MRPGYLPEVVLAPGLRLDRYTLIEPIATGGMAEVWLARQSGIGDFSRIVAIKRIHSHLARDPRFVQMFLHEARTAARLNHPNIAQIYDLGHQQGVYYLSMELVAGASLSAMQRRARKLGERLPPPLIARMIADAAGALHYAHQLRGADGELVGLVHRDVSPQNVLVSYEGAVKVVDFGVAKAATNGLTQDGEIKGKFGYLSPEQALARPVDARSDVFALGILLYELATGQRLFHHESELVILDRIAREPITAASLLVADLPRTFEAIAMKALERDPDRRYPSAEALQLALEAYLAEEAPGTIAANVAQWMSRVFPEGGAAQQRVAMLARSPGDEPTVRRAPRPPNPPIPVPERARPTPITPQRARPTPGSISPPRARPSPRPVAPPRSRGTPPPQPPPRPKRWPNLLVIVAASIVIAVAGSILWTALPGPSPTTTPAPIAVPHTP